jgi:hypothetical protein
VLALLFALAAVLNLDDPDAVPWVAFYAAAAIAAGWRALRPGGPPRIVPIGVAVVAAVWAAQLAPQVLGRVGLRELWSAWEMKNARVEVGREFYGLCLVLLGMIAIAVKRRPGR